MSTARSRRERIAAALVVGVSTLAGLAIVVAYSYAPAPVDPGWAVPGSTDIEPGSLTVRHTGTATLVFSDGETTWMTDGWFSRPGIFALLFGRIAPDPGAIERGLARNEIDDLAAVFPLHSHYDHAMDAPEVARRTGALLLGSESTANIARGWGLPEEQIRVVGDREVVRLGRFRITAIESRHFEFPDPRVRERALSDPAITEPLVPPARALDYRVGTVYVLHVDHPRGSFLVVGSAGYVEDALVGFDADTIFLGIGGLGSQTDAYREVFWRETVEKTHAERVIPIHWDSLTGRAEGPFTGPARTETFLAGGTDRTLDFLKAKQAEPRELEFWTLPRYDAVVLFEPWEEPAAQRNSRDEEDR